MLLREGDVLEGGWNRVHDNCTHGVEVIGETGRLRGPGLIFIEVVADLLDPTLGIVKLPLTGNSKLVFPPVTSLPRLPSVQ